MEEIAALAKLEASLTSAHADEFPPAEPPQAPPPQPVDVDSIRRACRKEALQGVSWFSWSERRAAKQRGQVTADAEVQAEEARRDQAHAEQQAELDAAWARLLKNDPETVVEALEAAFEDNEAPAVPIDCSGDLVAIVMMLPSVESVPDKKPAVTPTGKATIHKRSKTERNELYAQSLASKVLATVREAFAVAPKIASVAVLTVSKHDDVGGIPMVAPLSLAGFNRDLVEQFNWTRLDPLRTLEAVSPSLLNRRGATGELAPLDLSAEPELAAVLRTFAEMLELQIDPRVKMPTA